MATAMKKRRQIRALDRLDTSPYAAIGESNNEWINRANRIAKEREKLIEATRGTDRIDLAGVLGRVV